MNQQQRASDEGLSQAEATLRLAQFGRNDPAPQVSRAPIVDLLLSFANPLVIILLFASIVSASLGEFVNASIIVTIVAMSVVLNFIQTSRSVTATARLRGTVAPTATVMRDSIYVEIARQEVVPGDLIQLRAGDLVPADARLLSSKDLHVQQSALTGESMPVSKDFKLGDETAETMVLLGTSVVSGTATARVLATGTRTQFGDIATRLRTRAPETEFDRGIKQFGSLITKTIFVLVLFIVIVRIAMHRSAFESLLFALALAVGLTPELLPMITSVTLGRGAIAMAKEKVIVKHLSAIQNLGSIDILCSDKTGTLTHGKMVFESSCDAMGAPSEAPLFNARLNSKFETGIRSPLDIALVEQPEPAGSGDYKKIDEIPFDFERRRLSVVIEKPGERRLIVKGAPEGILPLSISYMDGESTIVPLQGERRAACEETFKRLSALGLRVLAVATRTMPAQPEYRASDECDLVLVGFVAFSDPPREDVKQAIEALKRDGVHVKVLTGDNELVTRHLCKEVGLDVDNMVVGDQVESTNDWALSQLAERTSVFARMSPAQKNRVILALKHRSHVVGYLGDGINDAPSLHAADVGISVASAVDVARDAADIILLEDSLTVLHKGILEGRKAFGNVTKYVVMGTSSNFGNMFSMAAASIFLPFLPMLPTQVLANNLLYDVAQLTIPSDDVDPEVLTTPQRWQIGTLRNFMLVIGPISSLFDFLTFYVLLQWFHADEVFFHTGWFVESLATQTLVLLVIRTRRNPLKSRPSRPLLFATFGLAIVGVVLPYSPLGALLGFAPLPLSFLAFVAVATMAYLALAEVGKQWLLTRMRPHKTHS